MWLIIVILTEEGQYDIVVLNTGELKRRIRSGAIIVAGLFISLSSSAQGLGATHADDTATGKPQTVNSYNDELDLIDVGRKIIKGKGKRADTGEIKSQKLRITIVPAAGYTLQTGFAGIVGGNAAFYTDTSANASTILSSFTYTVRNQIIFPVQTSIFTKNNKYNITADWRYLYYPSYTYGIGGYTKLNDGYLISYSCVRLRQTVLRKLARNMYAGIGYSMDYFYGIKELDAPTTKATDFQQYGLNNTEFASGFTFNYLYDSRTNPINATRGSFINVVYRPNLVIFGNTATWRSLVIDVRKYLHLPFGKNNVLAFWTYEWLTINGKPPYLMMPNTGGDPYSNTGRGYIQGRYRGANMAYIEGEYRFAITRNGLLGGVVFANAQSFTEQATNKFETIAPGWGGGLRVKFNKFSRTNVAIDYAFGTGGSGGVFINVGEVF